MSALDDCVSHFVRSADAKADYEFAKSAEAELAAMRAALKPFADEAGMWGNALDEEAIGNDPDCRLTVGDLRRAQQALK